LRYPIRPVAPTKSKLDLDDMGDGYQGTVSACGTRGELMIDLFNHLEYDAWASVTRV